MPQGASHGRSLPLTVAGPWRSTAHRSDRGRRALERPDPPERRPREPTCRWRSVAGLRRPETGPSARRPKPSDRGPTRCRPPSPGEPPRWWCPGWVADRPSLAASRGRLPGPARACREPSARCVPPTRARAPPTHRRRREPRPRRQSRTARRPVCRTPRSAVSLDAKGLCYYPLPLSRPHPRHGFRGQT